MDQSKGLFKKLGIAGIGLCALCCALPILGVMLGVGSLTVLAKYFEWAGIAALGLAAVFFAIWIFRKRKSPACDINCDCKPVAK